MPRSEYKLQNVKKEDLVAYLNAGKSIREIAKIYDCAFSVMRAKIEREGISTDKLTNQTFSSDAFDLSDALIKKYGISNPPVDVETIAKQEGYNVIYSSDFEPDLSGLLAGKTIYLNANEKKIERVRFTLSHELGHALLHAPKEHKFVGMRMMNDYSDDQKRLEREANLFSANLLMNKAFIQKDLENAVVNDDFISKLARKYKVSLTAMTIRLNMLGYV